jgi:hypothetical protein
MRKIVVGLSKSTLEPLIAEPPFRLKLVCVVVLNLKASRHGKPSGFLQEIVVSLRMISFKSYLS